MLTETDQKLLNATIIKTIEPFYVKIMNSFDGFDRKLELLNDSIGLWEKLPCKKDTVISGIKDLLPDLKICMDKIDFGFMFVEIRQDKTISAKKYSEFRLELSLLKNRVSRLEKLIDLVCEVKEKYKS